jgi:hypothetical protein
MFAYVHFWALNFSLVSSRFVSVFTWIVLSSKKIILNFSMFAGRIGFNILILCL